MTISKTPFSYLSASLTMFLGIAAIGVSKNTLAAENKNLKLPHDQPSQDYIDLDDKLELDPLPYKQSTNQNSSSQIKLGNPSLKGNECDGLRSGDYLQAYNMYTKIFIEGGKVYIVYPVFTLQDPRDMRAGEANSARAQQNQMPPQYFNQFGQAGASTPYPSRAAELAQRFKERQARLFPEHEKNRQNQKDLVPVYQDIYYPPQVMIDLYGRPMVNAWGQVMMTEARTEKRVLVGYVTHDEAIALGYYNNGFAQDPNNFQNGAPQTQEPATQNQQAQQVPQQQRTADLEFPEPQTPGPQVTLPPQNRYTPPKVETDSANGCVALPYLRAIELEGATSIQDAMTFLKDNPSEITRDATQARSKDPTPQNLKPFAMRDPELKSR